MPDEHRSDKQKPQVEADEGIAKAEKGEVTAVEPEERPVSDKASKVDVAQVAEALKVLAPLAIPSPMTSLVFPGADAAIGPTGFSAAFNAVDAEAATRALDAATDAARAEAEQPWRDLIVHILGFLEAHPYVVGQLYKEMAARGLRL